MPQHQSKAFEWKNDVRAWLGAVVQYQRQTGLAFRTAALNHRESFPSSQVVVFVGRQVYQGLSEWAIKTALRDAATSLNLTIDDETIDFLAGLATASLFPAA